MSLALPPSGSDQPRGPLSPAAQADRLIPAPVPGGPPVADPPALQRAITPGALFAALRRRWQTALGVALVLCVAFAAAVWVLRPDKYTSFAILQVASAEPKVIQESARPSDGGIYMRTQLALVRSRPVLQDALKSKEDNLRALPLVAAQNDPVEWLEKQLIVEQVQNTELVRVSLASRGSGTDLKPIVNAVVKAYLAKSIDAEFLEKKKHLEVLQTVSQEYEKKIDAARKELQTIMTKDADATIVDPKIVAFRQSELIERSSAANRELATINTRIRELDIKIETAKARRDNPVPKVAAPDDPLDPLVERELDLDPLVAAADAEANKIRGHIREFDQRAASTATARGMYEQRLAVAEKAAAALRIERRAAIAARNQKLTGANAAQIIAEGVRERELLVGQVDEVKKTIADLQKKLGSLGIDTLKLEATRNQMERYDQFLRVVWDQKERLDVELREAEKQPGKSITRKRVWEMYAAEEGTVLSKSGRFVESAGGGVFGLLLGLFAVAFIDHRRNRIHCPADVSRGLRLRVIGALPKLSGAGAPSTSLARGLAESVDALRTTLLHLHSTPQGTVLMVASSGPGEGKTTLATALAASLARARCRTLIVDCDLRAPSLHRLFGVAQAPGVCEVLSRTTRVEAAIRPTAAECLDVLAAGEMSEAAAAGLAAPGAVQRLMDELRGRYDFIVIDSSPLMLVPDAMMVAGCVDGLLYSVRPGISRVAEVHAGYERLCEHRMPFLGVVVNGVPLAHSYAPGYGQAVAPIATVVETGQPL